MLGALGNIPSQYRWVMVALLPILLAAGYWYFLYSPAAEEIAKLNRQIDNSTKKLQEYQRTAANEEAFERQVAELQIELQKALTQLPDSKEIPDLIRKISDLVVRSGLEITLLQPKPEQLHEYYADVPVTVKMIGNYHALGRFFDDLARLPRIISVNQIKFDGHTEKNKTYIEAQCLATTYRFLDEGEAGAQPVDKKKKRRKRS